MAGTLVGNADDGGRSNEYILNFSHGQSAKDPGLTKHQRDVLRFTGRQFSNTIDRDHAIQQKFGFDTLTYHRKLEELQNHPDLSPMMKKRLEEAYSRPPSGLGPVTGGAPIDIVGKQLSKKAKQVKYFVSRQEPFQ